MTAQSDTLIADKHAQLSALAPEGSAPRALAVHSNDARNTELLSLVIGARYACFYCRDRAVTDSRCTRCGRRRIELVGSGANSRLVQLARRVKAASPIGSAKRKRDGILHSAAHSVAIVCSALGGFLAQHLPHAHGESPLFVTLLGLLLGAVAGYLFVALVLVLFLLAGGGLALAVAVLCVCVFAALRVGTLVLGTRGARVRAGLDKTLQRWLSVIFRPVFLLHGLWNRSRWSQKEKHEALTPVAPRLPDALPTNEHGATRVVLEGVITKTVGLRTRVPADGAEPLTTVALGWMGDTVGTWVQDAVIAPFTITTASGEQVHVSIIAGELCVAAQRAIQEEPGESEAVRTYATQLGIAKAKRKPLLIPPAKPLSQWFLTVGHRVRIEGGTERQQRSNTAETGYRETAFAREIFGDSERPIRLTVL